jgi:hypothetical protein
VLCDRRRWTRGNDAWAIAGTARLEVIVLEAHADAISVATLLSLTIAADRDKPKRTWSACRSRYQLGAAARAPILRSRWIKGAWCQECSADRSFS